MCVPSIRDCEQGRRQPERSARILLAFNTGALFLCAYLLVVSLQAKGEVNVVMEGGGSNSTYVLNDDRVIGFDAMISYDDPDFRPINWMLLNRWDGRWVGKWTVIATDFG